MYPSLNATVKRFDTKNHRKTNTFDLGMRPAEPPRERAKIKPKGMQLEIVSKTRKQTPEKIKESPVKFIINQD